MSIKGIRPVCRRPLPPDWTRRVGERVQKARLALGLRQDELADLAGLSAGAVVAVENGLRPLWVEALVALAAALEVTTDWLLHGGEAGRAAA